MYRYRLNNIIYRTIHNRIPSKEERYRFLKLFTKGNMISMGIMNCGYSIYILRSDFNRYSIFDTCVTAICGLYVGSIVGFVWPVTYCVIGVNVYKKINS